MGYAALNRVESPGWLRQVSAFNDRVQHLLFDPARLAPAYPDQAVTSPFPFNGFYPEPAAPVVSAVTWRLEFSGQIAKPDPLSLEELLKMPHQRQVTRLICIEGWSAIGAWAGVPLGWLLRHVQADLSAQYVGFRCADGYWTSIDMASALHPQTILATRFLDQPLPASFGFPLRLRIPTKLGFKNAKHITHLLVGNTYTGGFWEEKGYNWFAGL